MKKLLICLIIYNIININLAISNELAPLNNKTMNDLIKNGYRLLSTNTAGPEGNKVIFTLSKLYVIEDFIEYDNLKVPRRITTERVALCATNLNDYKTKCIYP